MRVFVPLLSLMLSLAVMGGTAIGDRPAERAFPAPAVNPNAVIWRTPEPPVDPQAGDVWVNPRDGMEMVYVAAGAFTLGASDAEVEALLKEHPQEPPDLIFSQQPQCQVSLSGYWIGRTEVTNAQYQAFIVATGHQAPAHWKDGNAPAGLGSFPVVNVSWDDACAYCEWAGGRLPSELEWEKAARGTDGQLFPWGNEWDKEYCRSFELITGRPYSRLGDYHDAEREWEQSHDPVRDGPVAVGSCPADASAYGCLDMAGNVGEWCADWYDERAYERYARGELTPSACGTWRVLRGGSWRHGHPMSFRCAGRGAPALRESVDSGFRCARGTVKAAPVILKSAPVVGTLKSAPVVGSIAPEPEVQGLTPSTTVSRAASAKGPPGNGADLVPPRLGSRGGWLQITNGTDHDAIVKLVAQADATKAVSPGSAVLHRAVYVSAHSSVKLERISPGQYRVLFCTGSGWDGGRNSFRTEYATRLFRRALLFSEQLTPEGARYTTYTLTLHGVPGGTAVADAFSKRTFDAIK